MPQSVLMIGEDPKLIDFSAPDAPPDMSEEKIMAGLEGARDRLRAKGYETDILLTRDAETVETQVRKALGGRDYDVIVIGAGLRTLPKMAGQFEKLINVLHDAAPRSHIAFNTRPDDSDAAALRFLQ